MSFVAFATRAKGPVALFRRISKISRRYGLTSQKMDQSLGLFAQVLDHFDCCATFPVTAVALRRNKRVISKYLDGEIEFAVHGYTHIDYSELAFETSQEHLRKAFAVFADAGVPVAGFRSPYLRRGENLSKALESAGFVYASNQPILWDVLDESDFEAAGQANYRRALVFYAPWSASDYLSLPRLHAGFVEIPVSLPDDEILLDRLNGEGKEFVEKAWRRILSQVYKRGELFVLQLHPERIALAVKALTAVLTEAHALTPPVWMASLQDIAAWWKARTEAVVYVREEDQNRLRIEVSGPAGTTVLVRGIEPDAQVCPWLNGYQRVLETGFIFQASRRPFIGISPEASPQLGDFLRQQGYIVEVSPDKELYSYYFEQESFLIEDERSLLFQIEEFDAPLVKLSRWPDGARSALSITGDIDGLTIWDYLLRFLGR